MRRIRLRRCGAGVWGGVLAGLLLLAMTGAGRADVMQDWQTCQSQAASREVGIGGSGPRVDMQYCAGIKAYMAKDYATALSSLDIAASHGVGGAMGLLGFMYERGKGMAANPLRAFAYYKQGAMAGNGDAMHELGRCYQSGIGTARNEAEANKWLAAAEQRGTQRGPQGTVAKAEPDTTDFDAGVKQYEVKNFAGAFQTFMRAANAGNSRAMLQVGSQYEQGEGVAKSDTEAVRWYAKAANLGEPTAEKNLGQMYENGQGVKENWPLAAQWYEKSANQSDVEGEFALGRAYEFGIGIPQDRAKAIHWFAYAGQRGSSKGAYFAKWLSEPTNFIGFRNTEEHNYVMDRLHYAGDFLGGDPAGRAFQNSSERSAFIVAFKQSAVFHEAQTQWGVRNANFQTCQSNGGSSCQRPGPPPAVP